VRRYYLGYPNGCAIIGSKEDHLARPGKSMSQRVKAASDPLRIKVAVVAGRTLTQAHITPSGIEKQLAECFMKQPISTEAEYERYCLTHGMEIPAPADQPTHTNTTISGEKRKVWLAPARQTAIIGKLVDDHGMKLVPRPIPQVSVINTEKGDAEIELVDLLCPLYEFAAKGCMRSLLGLEAAPHSKLRQIHIPGPTPDQVQVVDALIVELDFFRTGSASENIPSRSRMFSADGMDGHIAKEGFLRLYPEAEFKAPDTSYAEELIEVGRKIMKWFPQYATQPKSGSGN